METPADNKAKLGSEPLKETFGNTTDKPDNIKKEEKPSGEDTISRGAHQDNLTQPRPDTDATESGK